MKRRQVLAGLAATVPALAAPALLPRQALAAGAAAPAGLEPMAAGPFAPNWDSLATYDTPEWFRNAKFGLWAHWGPQCEPEYGDWYARYMYVEGSNAYRFHVQKYGHPSKTGFKDVIRQWQAAEWNPDSLLALYRTAGARYFVALANHHDNFDLYDSRFQPNWNATRIGPRKDLIGGWARAARANGLRFGVSMHASHAWTWYEVAQGADKTGPYAGIPYDGVRTRADGKGAWWEGLDPQELYAQRHPLSRKWDGTPAHGVAQWNWGGGAALPSRQYIETFHNRVLDLIGKYDPDLIYFDDDDLPFWPVSDAGLRIAAHMYNRSIATRGGLDTVITGKMLQGQQRRSLVLDIERGQSAAIDPLPWQTCTCIGGWHYARGIYDRHGYKSAQTVVHMLVDIVSKNGNLLLSVPVRGNGTIDEQEQAIVEEIGRWMARYGEGIYDTRPWAVFGEGPGMAAAPLTAQGFNEGKGAPLTAADVRFTAKGDTVYAFVMGWPAGREITIAALGTASGHLEKPVARVEFVGAGQALAFTQAADGLRVTLPPAAPALPYAFALKVLV
ncbi:alpha-L-fucosidase [Massilia sp. Root335]|uniref:alpha-L-fucosidase n=1 Tax=Massilia sp. Root335 TaxID=1736517 RepID=UPI0009EA02AF|nr:alpha-L-fucosidase [Massilia sp. Root335]